jgi:Fe2+ or Zn2+ uptake regulation protein
MKTDVRLRALGLSKKEDRVLVALRDGARTPLALSRVTKVSRPAVYTILQNLKKRGLVESRIVDGKKQWRMCNEHEIDRVIADAKHALLKTPEGSTEVYGMSDSSVVVHRGAEAIKRLMLTLFAAHPRERLLGFQGDTSTIGWNHMFSVPETNKINRDIKNNRIIVEAILPEGWLEEQTKLLGVGWAKDFEGRTTRVNVIDPKYFKHGGQCFIFKDSLYFFALNEELLIEVRNSEIQKMILSIFAFIQDNSHVIDANELLRKLMEQSDKKS